MLGFSPCPIEKAVAELQNCKKMIPDPWFALLHVGMTPAREKLLLTSSAENAFTERLMALAA